MSLSNLELIYNQIMFSPPKSTIERKEIKRLSSQNRHGASSVKTKQYDENKNNNNDPTSSVVVGELQTLANYSSHSTNRVPEIIRIFDKMLLSFSASKTVGDSEQKHHLDLCNEVLSKLSDSIVEDVTSLLVDSLNFVSAASSSSNVRNSKNRAKRKTSWFSVFVDEILPYLMDSEGGEEEDDDYEDILPLSLKSKLESSDFWKDLSADIQCLNRVSKITLRFFSSSPSSSIDFKQQTIEKIAQALLLRVDYHFNNNNNRNSKRDTENTEPSPFATRPEHVLQYIGSQWLLLHFLTRKLESSLSATSSTNMNFYDSLTNYYSTEVGKIFNSICVSPIIISAHLQNLGGDAASFVGSFKFLGDASFLKKMSSKLSASSSSSFSESKTSSSPPQQQSSKEEQMIIKQLSNLKLLHLFNTFSEFVSQMEDIFDENFSVTTESRNANDNNNLPCVTSSLCWCSGSDDVNDKSNTSTTKNNTILVFSIITAIQDYCVRALSELNQNPISEDFSDDDDDDDDVHNNKLLQQIETTREKLERMRSKSQSVGTENEYTDRDQKSQLELLLTTTASSSSSRSFYLSNFGQLQCPHYAVTCSDFALSLVGQHLPLLRLAPSSSSSSSSFSLFTRLFLQKVLREVILGFFASKISSSIEKSVSLASGIGYRTRDVLLSLSESTTKPNHCRSISNLVLLQYFAALLVRVVVPLLEIEETFCDVLPEMLCQKNEEEIDEQHEFARHVLVDPLQKFIQTTRQTISSTGVIKKIVSAAMTTNKNNNNMKKKQNSSDSDKNSDDMKIVEDSNDDDDDEKHDDKEAFIEEYKTIVWNLKLHFEQVLLCFVNGEVSNSSPALFSFFQNSSKTIVEAWEMVFGNGSKMTPRIEAIVTKMREREEQQELNEKREAEEKRKVRNNIDGEFLDEQIQKDQSMPNPKPTTGILEKFADHLEDHHVPNQEIVSKTTETTKETEAEANKREQHQQEEREERVETPLTPFDFTKNNKSAKEINDINKPSAVPVSYDDGNNENSMSFILPERQEEDFEKLVKAASSSYKTETNNNNNNQKLPPLGGVAAQSMMPTSSLSSSPALTTTNLRQEEEQTTRRSGNPLQLTPLKSEKPPAFDVDENNTKSLQAKETEKDFAENSFKLYGEKQESDFIIAPSKQQQQKKPRQLLPSSLSESEEDVDDEIETPLFKPASDKTNNNNNDETSTTPPKNIPVPHFKSAAVSSPSSSSTTTVSTTFSPSSSSPSPSTMTTINNNSKKAPVPFPTFANIKKVAPKKIVFPPKKTFVLPTKKKTIDDDNDEDIL